MLKKLRLKLVCVMMAIVTVMLCVIFGLVLHFAGQALENQSVQMLQNFASERFFLGSPDQGTDQGQMPYFSVTVGRRGEVLATGGEYDSETLAEILTAALSAEEPDGVLTEYNLRYSKAPSPKGERIVFADMTAEREAMVQLIGSCLIIEGLGFLVFLALSILLAKWMVKPVDQAWRKQRQFVADASHELKTPLTVIMTNAELLQDPAQGQEAKRQFSGNILTMSRQMRGLVEGLLELARVDNGAVKTSFAELDFSQLTGECAMVFEALYYEKGLNLTVDIHPGLRLKGSAAHLRQVQEILLDNALKYTAPGGTVTVGLKRQGGQCILSVAGPGAPISPEDLKNIFERFYRIDKSRSRDGSYGLGLSIARGIVEEHRGRIWAQSEKGCNSFFVQLPLNR